mmetsp:Transcript_71646/g.135103  ORF Transcript_71646/g.135103 Transcript_71646/m.135103 type:complete len:180 (-) Transcript_71646:112-651(-)
MNPQHSYQEFLEFLTDVVRIVLTLCEGYYNSMTATKDNVFKALDLWVKQNTCVGNEPSSFNAKFPVVVDCARVVNLYPFYQQVREICQDFRGDIKWTHGAIAAFSDAAEDFLAATGDVDETEPFDSNSDDEDMDDDADDEDWQDDDDDGDDDADEDWQNDDADDEEEDGQDDNFFYILI